MQKLTQEQLDEMCPPDSGYYVEVQIYEDGVVTVWKQKQTPRQVIAKGLKIFCLLYLVVVPVVVFADLAHNRVFPQQGNSLSSN